MGSTVVGDRAYYETIYVIYLPLFAIIWSEGLRPALSSCVQSVVGAALPLGYHAFNPFLADTACTRGALYETAAMKCGRVVHHAASGLL